MYLFSLQISNVLYFRYIPIDNNDNSSSIFAASLKRKREMKAFGLAG
jgi:hypothetical protein